MFVFIRKILQTACTLGRGVLNNVCYMSVTTSVATPGTLSPPSRLPAPFRRKRSPLRLLRVGEIALRPSPFLEVSFASAIYPV